MQQKLENKQFDVFEKMELKTKTPRGVMRIA